MAPKNMAALEAGELLAVAWGLRLRPLLWQGGIQMEAPAEVTLLRQREIYILTPAGVIPLRFWVKAPAGTTLLQQWKRKI